MEVKNKRKSDRITVAGGAALRTDKSIPLSIPPNIDFKCINCNERYYFVEIDGEPFNRFCTNCGYKTPLRTLRHERNLKPHAHIRGTAIASASDSSGHSRFKDRKPKSMLETHNDPAIDSTLANRTGITIVNTQTIVPR